MSKSVVAVLTPPASSALTRAATVRIDLDIDLGTSDDYIANLIDQSSGMVAGFCNRPFGIQALSETVRNLIPENVVNSLYPFPFMPGYAIAPDSRKIKPLILRFTPITVMTSITEDGVLLDPASYEVDPGTGFVWRLYGNAIRGQWVAATIVVTYAAGYGLPNDTIRTLPYEIENVVLELIRARYFARGSDPQIILEVTENVGRTGYTPGGRGGGLTEDMKMALAKYVRRY